MDAQPLVTIFIVTWNRCPLLKRAIESALAQDYTNIEVIVFDNDSKDGTAAMVEENFPNVQLIKWPENIGATSGKNEGFRNYCRGDFMYQLDDDGWLAPDAITVVVNRALSDPRIAVVMSRIIWKTGDPKLDSDHCYGTQPVYIGPFVGCCSMFRASALKSVNVYQDDFFRQGEEAHLAMEFLDHGMVCFYEPASVMYHAVSALNRNDHLISFLNLRNKMKTGFRLWPFPFCLLRPVSCFVTSIKWAFSKKYPALPFQLLKAFLLELPSVPSKRKPVRRTTYHLFRKLEQTPLGTLPESW